MRALLPLLLLAACDEEGAFDPLVDEDVEALPVDEAGPPGAPLWHHFAWSQIVPGFPAGGTWTRRQPGSTVTFLYSDVGTGLGPCAPTGAPCLDLVSPLVLGKATTDRNGRATFMLIAPATLTGTHWIQAAEHRRDGTWRVSEVVERDPGFVTCPAPGSQTVCAADRDVYGSECEANAAGWPVLFAGTCP